jgi:hypothetical protein
MNSKETNDTNLLQQESILDLNLPNGNDLQQYGRLLLDGDINIKAHEDQKTKHRYAFIFEQVMILVKNSNSKIGVSVSIMKLTLDHSFCSILFSINSGWTIHVS